MQFFTTLCVVLIGVLGRGEETGKKFVHIENATICAHEESVRSLLLTEQRKGLHVASLLYYEFNLSNECTYGPVVGYMAWKERFGETHYAFGEATVGYIVQLTRRGKTAYAMYTARELAT